MKKFNILVFPCGSEIGLELQKSLSNLKEIELWGASSVDDHGKFVFSNYIPNLPFINDDSIIDKLKEIVVDKKIDAIYPATDLCLNVLSQNEEKLGCKIVSSSHETTSLCLSKELTYKKLKGIIETPIIIENNDEIRYPIFAKPKIGYGSRGAKKIKNQNELITHTSEYKDCILTEFLPGEEFTIDCFTNKDSELIFCKARIRQRILNGISVNTKEITSDFEKFEAIANKINETIPFKGAWFFQVKKRLDGTHVLLEIASRFGGSSSLWKAIGVNLPLLSIYVAFGFDVSILQNNSVCEMDRALSNVYKMDYNFDKVYFDFDDCILIKDKLNTTAIQFIFDCINKNIKTILITRHNKSNLIETLKQLRIYQLFDDIIHIQDKSPKSNFIEPNSIFFDDSFSERLDVVTNKKIPSFGVESLMCFTSSL